MIFDVVIIVVGVPCWNIVVGALIRVVLFICHGTRHLNLDTST